MVKYPVRQYLQNDGINAEAGRALQNPTPAIATLR